MPQLDLLPWFGIYFLSWLTLMTIASSKLSLLKLIKNPSPKNFKFTNPPQWQWPWL